MNMPGDNYYGYGPSPLPDIPRPDPAQVITVQVAAERRLLEDAPFDAPRMLARQMAHQLAEAIIEKFADAITEHTDGSINTTVFRLALEIRPRR
jgi:hypothetical protein